MRQGRGSHLVTEGGMDVSEYYFTWLRMLVSHPNHTILLGRYNGLLKELFDIPFFCCLDADFDRVEDGLSLRKDFYKETELFYISMDSPASVLEVLIGIAKRMEYIVAWDDESYEPPYTVSDYFWMMIDSLDLLDYTDESCSFDGTRLADMLLVRALDIWMHRSFEYDGSKSIFKLNNPPCDQRTTPITYQMNYFIRENFMLS